MTLDLEKFISNSIKTQAKIQHLAVSTKTTKSAPKSVKDIIASEYGENYLLDADYVSFFWGDIGKEEVKKLFNVVDKALGKSANKLTETDFKKIDISNDSQSDNSQDEQSSDDQLDDTVDADSTEDDSSLNADSAAGNETADGSSTDELNEDDTIDTAANDTAEKQKRTNYFFLKITLK